MCYFIIKLGSVVLKMGKAIIIAVDANVRRVNGVTPANMSSRLTSGSATPLTPYTTRPTGGVIVPACMAKITDMPNHTGSIPISLTTG